MTVLGSCGTSSVLPRLAVPPFAVVGFPGFVGVAQVLHDLGMILAQVFLLGGVVLQIEELRIVRDRAGD